MDLYSIKAKQMFSAWDYTVKLVWDCPPWSRTYFLQHLLCCGFPSARVDIQRRFVNFYCSLNVKCKSWGSSDVSISWERYSVHYRTQSKIHWRHFWFESPEHQLQENKGGSNYVKACWGAPDRKMEAPLPLQVISPEKSGCITWIRSGSLKCECDDC